MSANELDTIWEHLNQTKREHEALHRDHVQLRTAVLGRINALDARVDSNHLRREAQHKELMAAINALNKKEDQRDGMWQIGKIGTAFIAGFVAFVIACITLVKLFIEWASG